MNVKFHNAHAFEPTPEVAVFDLLGIPLVHGWLMDQTGQGKVVDPKIFMGLYFLSRSVNGVGLEE